MRRWIVLLLVLPAYAFMLMLVGYTLIVLLIAEDWGDIADANLLDLFDLLDEPEWWLYFGTSALVVVASQVLFLLPMFTRRPPRDQRSRPLVLSLVVGGIIAGGLTMGLGTALIDLIALVALPEHEFDDKTWLWGIPLLMLVGGWVFWSYLLLMFERRVWADRVLGRLIGLLLGGTLLEVLVVLPLDIMARRRTDCYCATGTFCTLLLATIATLWLAGPGIVIALTSRRHRLWRRDHCDRCGYPKGPSPGTQCPECGWAWHGAETRGTAVAPSTDKG